MRIACTFQTWPADPVWVRRTAAEAEQVGLDIFGLPETGHDPVVALAYAAAETTNIALATTVAIAFARNPMSVAMLSNDMQQMTGGRFILGLGSQIQPNITKRYSMPWGRPAERMRQFIFCVKEIQNAWREDRSPKVRTSMFRHTFSMPFYEPERPLHPPAPVALAAVGPRMCRTAGLVADVCSGHLLSTADYYAKVSSPAVREGESESGRPAGSCQYSKWVGVVTGSDEREMELAAEAAKRDLAVHLSTPSYQVDLPDGYQGLRQRLSEMLLLRDFESMVPLIDDDLLRRFFVVGEPESLGERLAARVHEGVDILCVAPPKPLSPLVLGPAVKHLKGL